MQTIYEQLSTIAAGKARDGYLCSFVNDLHVIDRDTLAAAAVGARFVWALRPSGTALYPVGVGHDARWLTYWLDDGNDRHAPTLTYLVEIQAVGGVGTVQPIGEPQARKLTTIPHPAGWRFVVSLNGSHYLNREGARV